MRLPKCGLLPANLIAVGGIGIFSHGFEVCEGRMKITHAGLLKFSCPWDDATCESPPGNELPINETAKFRSLEFRLTR